MYQRLDEATARRLDATYPDAAHPRSQPVSPALPGPAAPRGDREDPARHLVPPPKPTEFTDPAQLFNDFTDLVSPTVWMNKAIELTTKFNPLEALTKLLVGNWEGYARCAGAWQALSKYSQATASNLRQGLQAVDARWDGKAAEAAFGYFDYTIRALESQATALEKLHREYMLVAETVWHFAKATADILKGIVDRLTVLALTLCVAPFLAATGIGVFAGMALGALQCAKIISLWGDITRMTTNVQNAVHGSIGVMQAMVNDPAFTALRMPVSDYRHPGV
ncbi:hypothetical protein NLX83_06495 [Allokutzneria sp. A3M-2-11 16]|uniref:hypothetical protein n=1 Tax=Allokutzneria sp. A3M-2-11 16 TaxID=2962043 RepID=UPI0020B7FA78|nr:hypothetical protein [Allokutzneria sp. A3M-2-11 16]MCP3798903.1 hypothetical protein [Allokutzneria sp. A3M-2-11 16]